MKKQRTALSVAALSLTALCALAAPANATQLITYSASGTLDLTPYIDSATGAAYVAATGIAPGADWNFSLTLDRDADDTNLAAPGHQYNALSYQFSIAGQTLISDALGGGTSQIGVLSTATFDSFYFLIGREGDLYDTTPGIEKLQLYLSNFADPGTYAGELAPLTIAGDISYMFDVYSLLRVNPGPPPSRTYRVQNEYTGDVDALTASAAATAVPEPLSLSLFGAGLGAAACARRKKRRG